MLGPTRRIWRGRCVKEIILFANPVANRWNTLNAPKEALHLRMLVATHSEVGCHFLTGKGWVLLSTMTFAHLPVFKTG